MKGSSLFAIALIATIFLHFPQPSFCQEEMHEEFNGPFRSWLDAKRDFQARGDGKTDDTKALQAAINEAAKGTRNPTVYLSAGVYRITAPLTLKYAINVSVIGADPRQTIIRWAGAPGNTMLCLNGVAYSKFNRITFDGAGNADAAIDQSWDGNHPYFDTANEYADDIFKDAKIGIRGGAAGHGFAETSIRRCQFLRNTVAGVSLGNFNALDVWINGCYFEDCSTGVTNTLGAGNFKVYNCGFRHSIEADMSIRNTGEFAVRDNTSFGSSRFFVAEFTRNPAPTTIEANTIIDPINTDAIIICNQGPVFIMGNSVRSVINSTGPVIRMNTDGFCFNNTFTVTDPVAAAGRDLVQNNRTEAPGILKKMILPSPVTSLATTRRPLIEVAAGADAAAIQAAINRAAKLKGKRPVVHLPYGKYTISSTIVIPKGSDLQLVGDGFGDHNGTLLNWLGQKDRPMLLIEGPAKCTLRDFTLKSKDASANILINHADDPGSTICLQGFHQNGGQIGLLADQLEYCHIFCWDGGFSGLQNAFKIVGSGKLSAGFVRIYSGATSNNTVTHLVTNDGMLYVADEWYEGSRKSTFAQLSGKSVFFASGCHVAVPGHYEGIALTRFSGKAIFTANNMSGACTVDDNSTGTLVIAGTLTELEPFLSMPHSLLHVIRKINTTRNHGSTALFGGSLKIDDSGISAVNAIQNLDTWKLPGPGECSETTLFVYRVMSIGGGVGILANH